MISPFQSQEKTAEEAKNSKILQRKQIEKRLQGLKTEQYEKISTNLQMQNEKLKNQVKNLSEKVQELVQSRKISKNKNPQIEQEIAKLKRELDLKYESMGHLKEQVSKSKQSHMTEQMRLKIQQHSNTMMKCDKELRQHAIEKQKLKTQIEKNEADLKDFLPNNELDVKMDVLRADNKELKSKLNRLKDNLTEQEKSSKFAINKIYQLKGEEKRGLIRSSSQIAAGLKEIKSASLSEINELEREIESLKVKKKDAEKDFVTDKIIKEMKKNKLEKEIKDGLEAHKQLYKRRVKGVNQLNLYERKEYQLKHQLQKSAEIVIKTFNNGESQTQKVVPQQFRKEWIGKSDGLMFNDTEILQYRGQTLIKGVTIYKTPQNIVFAKFHYQSPEKKKYESQPPFEKFVLKKCEAKKYESKTFSALCGLIVSVHSQNKRIVRIQLKWADGDSSIIGWDIEGSIRFPFDITANEKPVCMFGSVSVIGKFSYALQSLGCEINTFDE